jgi:hypothetical protein
MRVAGGRIVAGSGRRGHHRVVEFWHCNPFRRARGGAAACMRPVHSPIAPDGSFSRRAFVPQRGADWSEGADRRPGRIGSGWIGEPGRCAADAYCTPELAGSGQRSADGGPDWTHVRRAGAARGWAWSSAG